MNQASKERDLNAILACAEAYLRLAEPSVIKIKELPESKQPNQFSFCMGDAVAGATNLAFAIELYIKAILIVSKIEVPQGRDGHNLAKLYAVMPEHFKIVIGESYEKTRKKDWMGQIPSITLSIGQAMAGIPKWEYNHDVSLELEALLHRSSNIFTSWRYIFEFEKPDEDQWCFHRLEYGLLLSACRAMRDTVNQMKTRRAGEQN